MNSEFGTEIRITVFGESHGAAVGAVLTGLPAGIEVPYDEIALQMSRRAPGRDKTATPRREKDIPEILSGVYGDRTTGAPLALIIRNEDTISKNYDDIKICPRPSHSDYPAYVKYGGFNDIRGGGHFSGRLTAPIVAAGTVCRAILSQHGVTVGGHIKQIGNACDSSFDDVNVSPEQLKSLSKTAFPVIDAGIETDMRARIEAARLSGDSVGGIAELAVTGIPAGLGNPMFGGIENIVAAALYGIPAVKAVAFGLGFDFAKMNGSTANDEMYYENGIVRTKTNHCGGICGGITNGMPLIITAGIKPTPSVSVKQHTVNLKTGVNSDLEIKGRHDPCIVPRALPALEAILSVALLDIYAREGKL